MRWTIAGGGRFQRADVDGFAGQDLAVVLENARAFRDLKNQSGISSWWRTSTAWRTTIKTTRREPVIAPPLGPRRRISPSRLHGPVGDRRCSRIRGRTEPRWTEGKTTRSEVSLVRPMVKAPSEATLAPFKEHDRPGVWRLRPAVARSVVGWTTALPRSIDVIR
jgi:hypothetical protein